MFRILYQAYLHFSKMYYLYSCSVKFLEEFLQTLPNQDQIDGPMVSMDIGSNRITKVVHWNDSNLINFAVYEKDDISGAIHKTQKEIFLTLERYKVLCQFSDLIDNAVVKLENLKPVKFRHHLGGHFYVSVTQNIFCVDVRKFYFDQKRRMVKPTKQGIAFKLKEWKNFVQSMAEINMSLPLDNVLTCIENPDHANVMAAMECTECHPNGVLEI